MPDIYDDGGLSGGTLERPALQRLRVHDNRIDIDLAAHVLADHLQLSLGADTSPAVTIAANVRLTRSGRAVRLVREDGRIATTKADPSSIGLLLKARRWWEILRQGEVDVKTLAASEGVSNSYVTRVLRLAFLAPAVVDGILAGKVRAGVDAAALVATNSVSLRWVYQGRDFLPGSVG
ncbi:MAG: resolvase [Bradyrhizobium sp.]|nr:resolvase [Bradyrhizobium sp.]